jgi:protein-tyrosine phosphatase
MCRSPLAEVCLRAWLEEAGVDVHVASAGFLTEGRPVPPELAAVAIDMGLDLAAHRSSRLDGARLSDAEVVIVMTREHLREAATSSPVIWPRCFTLKELVRRGQAVGQRAPHEPFGDWLARVHEGRTTKELLGADSADDVEDPMGGSPLDYRNSAVEISRLVERLAALIWSRSSGRAGAEV